MTAISVQTFGSRRPSNVGGILELYLLDREQVYFVFDPVRHKIPEAAPMTLLGGMLAVKPGAELHRMKFPPLQCSFSQQIAKNDHGTYADVRIEYTLPGQDAELEDFYQQNSDREYICLFSDANGQAYIAGNEEKGLRLTRGNSIGGVNLNSHGLASRLTVPLLFLHSLVLSELFPDAQLSSVLSLDQNTIVTMSSIHTHIIHILAVKRGATFQESFRIPTETMDLTGCTAKCQVRKYAEDYEVALELDAEIDITPEGQYIILSKHASEMLIASGAYVYDVKVTDPEEMEHYPFGGRFEVLYGVTR